VPVPAVPPKTALRTVMFDVPPGVGVCRVTTLLELEKLIFRSPKTV
jgi:hypothetical protein